MLLRGKSGCIDEEEKRGGEINEEGDDDPEVFGVKHVKNSGVLYLFV
jgi:hypothetical protein